MWVPLFLVSLLNFGLVSLALFHVIGGVMLALSFTISLIVVLVLMPLSEWREIRGFKSWSSLRIAILCIAADLIVLPYLALRLHLMQQSAGA